MRSTRATAAIERLNRRAEGHQYSMVVTGDGFFKLREQIAGESKDIGEPLELDSFVRFVDAHGPQKTPRISRYDAAFAKQLVKKS